MDDDQQHGPGPIGKLPTEIMTKVLSCLPDVASLKSALVSSPIIFRPCWDQKTTIKIRVLFNAIDPGVFPEAVAAYASSKLRGEDGELKDMKAVTLLLHSHFSRRTMPKKAWTLAEQCEMGQFHVYVADLTKKFNTSIIDSGECTNRVTEDRRVQRALYLFEVFCNVFRRSPSGLRIRYNGEWKNTATRVFFKYFAPWEVEQLACIRDFRGAYIAPIYTNYWYEIAESYGPLHNEIDGDEISYVAVSKNALCIDKLLSQGLKVFHRFSKTGKLNDLDAMLAFEDGSFCSFLEAVSDYYHELDSSDDPSLLEKEPFFDDPTHITAQNWRREPKRWISYIAHNRCGFADLVRELGGLLSDEFPPDDDIDIFLLANVP
ncbi:hypothetical protein F5Y16DRAFT_416053 [Xylariaceae sp. FL0255]|nr:hypothetical protein F5Y16DRAFT_416053 [Xylariaceae sp. FL0255]